MVSIQYYKLETNTFSIPISLKGKTEYCVINKVEYYVNLVPSLNLG